MLNAVAQDFASAGKFSVSTILDPELDGVELAGCTVERGGEETMGALDRLAAEADWTVIIAPELGGVLEQLSARVALVGGRLLGPSGEALHVAADKQRTATWLAERGIAAPEGCRVETGAPLPDDFPYPAVIKPCDGAGSSGVFLLGGPDDLPHDFRENGTEAQRLERYCPGFAASVAVLCGPAGYVTLPACAQRLSRDRRMTYRGGRLPLAANMARRAERLALAAIDCLPDPLGYVGVDLVLGGPDDGSADIVIEINPRLTTSYVGLRAALDVNLAAAMVEVAQGGSINLPSPRLVSFDSAGRVRTRALSQ